MAIKYYCDECGIEVEPRVSTLFKNKKYAMILDVGKKQIASMYGTGVAGAVDLCNRCKLEVVKELLNVK